ncbi:MULTISPECIES: hypothetical protein [Chitinophaga]|uniref:hypothetical protein n=1 Tax=Chitinophaga TaxID=79328 RepID=UPI000DB90E5F|nr:hypothetical protein [Chitinophaga ginsengisegetis]MDR6567440.1 hypothetical protein [Chitinophaga ginsengisegetis]MDR6647171.1 hypothetical protein [Chitinophaga ginsengisegetis]MDR6653520.1 hypothetical protein [Chitinophaga ginsengisegetis]
MKAPSNLPRIPLRIDEDDQDFISIDSLPPEYQHLAMPAAKISFRSDDYVDIISQTIKFGRFTLRTHEVYNKEHAIMLIPYTKIELLALHFMAGGEVVAEITDNGPYMMAKREMTLFKLEPSAHKAPMKPWDNMFSFHINITPEDLAELALEYPELAAIVKKTGQKGSAPVNAEPYHINLACTDLIDAICNCKFVGKQAEVFMHRCCLELYFNFAAQDKLEDEPMRVFPLYVSEKLEASIKYLINVTNEKFSMAKMAVLLDLGTQELREAFIDSFFMTPEHFHFQRQMIQAYGTVTTSAESLEKVCTSIAMNNVNEFTTLFESYFNCSIAIIRNSQ